jgi:hypothetical protein
VEITIIEIAAVLRSTESMADQFAKQVQQRVGQPVSHAEILAAEGWAHHRTKRTLAQAPAHSRAGAAGGSAQSERRVWRRCSVAQGAYPAVATKSISRVTSSLTEETEGTSGMTNP